jgi:hypothetical protein
MHADPPDEGFWVVAVDEQKLESVNHDGNELDLKRGENASQSIIESSSQKLVLPSEVP